MTAKRLRPTVILQDLVMPGVDGLDLVRQYRADPELQSTPIIVLSSKDQPTVKSDAFRAGANDYLVKLPDQIELVARIRYHSNAYLAQVQRDEAYRALSESQKRLMAANLELQRLSNVDGLTGLCNKRHFSELIEAEWRRASRDGAPLALLMIDVDHFKLYNDNYGHIAGDEALRQVATAIQTALRRPGDVTARFGGEEFAVILPQTDSSGAGAVADKIMVAVAALGIPHTASTTGTTLTVSIGGASVMPQQGESLFRLIDAADQALYGAKRRGRNLAVVHDQTQPMASKRPA